MPFAYAFIRFNHLFTLAAVPDYIEAIKDDAPDLVDMIVDVDALDSESAKEEYDEVRP